MSDVRLTEEYFERPEDFDLAAFWKAWSSTFETNLSNFATTVRVSLALVPDLPRKFGSQIHTKIAQASLPDADGWLRLTLSFENFEAARDHILSFGRGIEVLEPPALRRSVLDYAEQIVALYTLT